MISAALAASTFVTAHAQAKCGDGKVAPSAELCDDGNASTGDGCNAHCELEAGYVCNGAPSVCCFGDAASSYALQGDATSDPATGEITLTEDETNQVGIVWYKGALDFTGPFTITERAYLGTNDRTPKARDNDLGGDGMALLFQRDPRGLEAHGAYGGDLGAFGLEPVVGVELDTFDNGAMFNDLTAGDEDHTAIFHTRATTSLSGPACLNDGEVCANVEDGRYHLLEVAWTGNADRHLQVRFDGALRIDFAYDLIGEEFGGDPTGIYFGFAASTGEAHNQHKFCPRAPSGFRVPHDFDGDGLDDSIDPDDDDDGLDDQTETADVFAGADPGEDHDRDGIPDYRDPDYWRDVVGDASACPDLIAPIGSCDAYPASIDPDGDGVPAHLNPEPEGIRGQKPIPDVDGDGVPDALDVQVENPCSPVLSSAQCSTEARARKGGCSMSHGAHRSRTAWAWLALGFAIIAGRRRARAGRSR